MKCDSYFVTDTKQKIEIAKAQIPKQQQVRQNKICQLVVSSALYEYLFLQF